MLLLRTAFTALAAIAALAALTVLTVAMEGLMSAADLAMLMAETERDPVNVNDETIIAQYEFDDERFDDALLAQGGWTRR